jgi:hypothetical protein
MSFSPLISGRNSISIKAHSASSTSQGVPPGAHSIPQRGRAMIANDATEELCHRIGCGL